MDNENPDQVQQYYGELAREKETQAETLVRIGREAHLFMSQEGDPYATFRSRGHAETWPVRSPEFKSWLLHRYHEDTGKVPSTSTVTNARDMLEAQARYEGEQHEVHTRIGARDGAVYLDLANDKWEAVEITRAGWRIVSEPPVKFRRANLRPLPYPVAGGSVDELRSFVNVADDHDWMLLVSWALGTLMPAGPYPVLILHGERGSSKSTTSRFLKDLIDPTPAPIRSFPRDPPDLAIAARRTHVLAFDNLSYLNAEASDAVCRLATGGGYGTRSLYTDEGEATFSNTRPVILNGIEELATRGDLLDRAIVVSLPAITEAARREESALKADFAEARPRILGALCDGVARALRDRDAVRLERLPRMADFAAFATAAAPALGWTGGAFLAAYGGNREAAVDVELGLAVRHAQLALNGESDRGGFCR